MFISTRPNILCINSASGHSQGVRWKVNIHNRKHISHFSSLMEAQATPSLVVSGVEVLGLKALGGGQGNFHTFFLCLGRPD